MPKSKPKPRQWNPGRPTIKALQDRIKQLEDMYAAANRGTDYANTQRKVAEDRLKQIAMENESLLNDKKWLKSLIQNLVPGNTDARMVR